MSRTNQNSVYIEVVNPIRDPVIIHVLKTKRSIFVKQNVFQFILKTPEIMKYFYNVFMVDQLSFDAEFNIPP